MDHVFWLSNLTRRSAALGPCCSGTCPIPALPSNLSAIAERGTGLAAAPLTEPFPAAGALGAEPRSPVAKIAAHMRAVQVGVVSSFRMSSD